MKIQRILLCGLALLLLVGCAKKTTTSYYASAPTYLNDEADGSITVRAYGQGRNRSDAIEQAAKNAVRQVLFKGINVPGNVLLSKPLVTAVNAEEKYQNFFNAFFADGGAYMQFTSTEDRRPGTNTKEKNAVQRKYATTVRVLRPQLRNYLIENGIIVP